MLIEEAAYANRWRLVSPAAKATLAACGLVAAFVARQPAAALLVGALLTLTTTAGAGVSPRRFLRVAAAPLGFLALGCCSLAFSPVFSVDAGMRLDLLPDGGQQLAGVGARSLGALAALLFLALTTPLSDLIALLRRLRAPELLLDLMVLCYRLLFVFSSAVHDTLGAQTARLGYATPRRARHSLGGLTAALTLQVWQRAHALQQAADARNNDGPLRFLGPVFANSRREFVLALLAGSVLIVLAGGLR